MKRKLRITFNAPLVLTYALLCTVATLTGMIFGDRVSQTLFATHGSSWGDPMTYVRLFTHVIGHANLGHLAGNLGYILLLGPALEEKYGRKDLLTVILATALVTGLVHNLLFPHIALLGASGVAFAFILLTSFTAFRKGEIPLTVILVAVIYLGQQIWDGISQRDNISNLSHIIGGLIGAGAGWLLNGNGKDRSLR